MPGPRLVFALALVTLVASVAPFIGLLGFLLFGLAWRHRRNASPGRLRSTTLVLSAISSALGVGWIVVYAEPAQPCVRAESPIVSSVHGQTLTPEGSFVSGALYPWAERRDVLRATHLVPVNGEHVLRVDGIAGETLQIDSASLLVVEHEPAVEIVPTTSQTLVGVRDAVGPLAPLAFTDGNVRGEPVRTWRLSFPRPETARALLVLTARTTAFAEEAFARYVGTMGQAMAPFMAGVTKETCSDACRQEVWDDETERLGIPLVVQAQGGARQLVNPVGSCGLRRFAVTIEVHRGMEPLVAELQATPGFWEIESATLAPYAGEATGEVVPATSATLRRGDGGEAAEDVTPLVMESDRRRAAVRVHDSLELRFPVRAGSGRQAQTTFVVLRAHYRVPTGGKRFLNVAAIVAHRWGVTSLPRFAASLSR